MKKTNATSAGGPAVDAARLELMLGELRLPGIKIMWTELARRADKEGWPAARFLATLAEHEIAERQRRRIERHMHEARLPVGKTIDKGYSVVIWPIGIAEKDINDMFLAGHDVQDLVQLNTYSGLEAKLKFNLWKKV